MAAQTPIERFSPHIARGLVEAERSRDDAKRDVFACLETFYNPARLHQSISCVGLLEFYRQYRVTQLGVHETWTIPI